MNNLTIRETETSDLHALSEFLCRGFTPGSAVTQSHFAHPNLLQWKYLDPWEDPGGPAATRSYVAVVGDRIVGHVGFSPAMWRITSNPVQRIPTLHMMDWLSDNEHRGVGAKLMMRAHRSAEIPFGLGGSAAGRRVIGGAGYHLHHSVSLDRLVVRPTYHIRTSSARWDYRNWLRTVRDWRRRWHNQHRTLADCGLRLEFADTFTDGPINDIMNNAPADCVFTERTAARINHLLRCPAARIRGGYIRRGPDTTPPLGFFLIASRNDMIEGKNFRTGKIVDCLLNTPDNDVRRLALGLCTQALADENVDYITAYASTPPMNEALASRGYLTADQLEFRVRDPHRRLDPAWSYHLTPLEADYAYTQ